MKIGIIGVGAVGGYFGAKLANAGLDVTFIGTSRTVQMVYHNGLYVKSFQGDIHIKDPKIYHAFEAIKDADVVLFCVKSYLTEQLARALEPRLNKNAIIVSMQNGIENEKILADVFGAERVIGSVVFISSQLERPGYINHTGFGKVVFGELNGEVTPRVQNLAQLFLEAQIPADVTDNIYKELWKKLILNTAYNGYTCLIEGALKYFYDVPEAVEMFHKTLKEGQMLSRLEGYDITDEEINEIMLVTKSEGFLNFKTSTLQDLEKGKPLEIDAIQGVLLQIAEKHNVEVPLNKFIFAMLRLKMLNKKFG
ncbi:MAG: ketopantoate reductase family protein [Candidatus Gastranaerophilales bacterium]|nr:ketopantoate reductase family protein [Candidatus Gastranaerophilales bacterium]